MMRDFPDHPVIAAMERDGQLPDPPGWVRHCRACGAAIYPGEKYYLVDCKAFCEDHGAQALEEVTEHA